MMKTLKKVLSFVIVGMSIMAVSASAADAIPGSYVFTDGGTYLPGQMPEYSRSWLLASKLSSGPMYTQYKALSDASIATSYYKYNEVYYKRTLLAAAYITLGESDRTIANALTKITPSKPMTRVAKESTFSGSTVCYYTGLIPLSSTSSLSVGRPDGYTNFNTFENTANKNNSVGAVKYVFAAPLDKAKVDADINNVKIYLNDSTTEPAQATTIKNLLFAKFNHSTDGVNELSGSIKATYAGLKTMFNNYNDGTTVTKFVISGPTTSGGTESLTVNIQ